MSDLANRYPRQIQLKDGAAELELLLDPSAADVHDFAAGLPDTDLLFLSRNLQEPKVLNAWRESIAHGDIVSVAAKRDKKVLGTTAVVMDKMSWSAHVAELRILILPEARETGLGRELIQESFLIGLSLGLEKLTVRMTLEQEGAITIFEEMGFKNEALFRDHVKDSKGEKHDLLIMAHDVQGFASQMQAYGMDEAF
ncbi:MAG: L-amino acid N-acyltransferase YncA [Candidatus Azotimanducaceae bacterium]|jgi:L-amino acid N-acyltransferase YncA